jgi:dynein heavy chain
VLNHYHLATLQATKQFYDNKDDLLQLWCHETCRIIADRMWDPADKQWLRKQLDERLSAAFSTTTNTLFEAYHEEVRPII